MKIIPVKTLTPVNPYKKNKNVEIAIAQIAAKAKSSFFSLLSKFIHPYVVFIINPCMI